MTKKQKIVFESENGTNTIIDDGENYIILHANSKTAIFDRNRKILNKIKNTINREGNFQASDRNGFFMANYSGQFVYSLSQLIVSTAYKKSLSFIHRGRIKYLDQNKFNCCLNNMDCSKISNALTSPYTITHDDQYIYLKHKSSGKIARMTYIEDLYDVMCYGGIRWNYNDKANVFFTKINIKNKSTQLFLHQLTYVFYYYKGVTKRNYKTKILEYKENFAKYWLEVDHLDSNRMNDCMYNISAMAKSLNVQKLDISKKIIYPYFHFAVYTDGVYRVAIGKYLDSAFPYVNDEVIIQGYQCNTAESYVNLLKKFYDNGVLPNGYSLPVSPKKWYDSTPEHDRKHIDKVLTKVDKEKIIATLLAAANLALCEGKKDIKYAS